MVKTTIVLKVSEVTACFKFATKNIISVSTIVMGCSCLQTNSAHESRRLTCQLGNLSEAQCGSFREGVFATS
jgi:hypothetical protein